MDLKILRCFQKILHLLVKCCTTDLLVCNKPDTFCRAWAHSVAKPCWESDLLCDCKQWYGPVALPLSVYTALGAIVATTGIILLEFYRFFFPVSYCLSGTSDCLELILNLVVFMDVALSSNFLRFGRVASIHHE